MMICGALSSNTGWGPVTSHGLKDREDPYKSVPIAP